MSIKWRTYGIVLFLLGNYSLLNAASGFTSCDANQGLAWLNQTNPPLAKIKSLLAACDQSMPNEEQVLLLHGLLARKEGMSDNQYRQAISWLEKAQAKAPRTDHIPAMELAVTYEWANQPNKAHAIYVQILANSPDLRPAQLGLARTATAMHDLEPAQALYKKLLTVNPQDIEALNGMGRVLMAAKEYTEASAYFQHVLSLQPNNNDAQIGLQQVQRLANQAIQLDSTITPIFTCDSTEGLKLINQPSPPLLLVQQILLNCDREQDNRVQVLLLHGLTERAQKNYPQAIKWLKKAKAVASPDNPTPALELAVTYEWSHLYLTAQSIYEGLLASKADLRPALLGKARIDLWQRNNSAAQLIYTDLLRKDPHDVDALNGLARVQMAEGNYNVAANYLTQALQLQPNNQDAQIGMQQTNAAKSASQIAKSAPAASVPIKASPCDPARGLVLVNAKQPPLKAVQQLLNYCDNLKPHDPQVYLLHGLLARSQKDYPAAIRWLAQAKKAAPSNDPIPTQELALTYEWALQLKSAQALYQELLRKNPKSRPALLGAARVNTAEYHIHSASLIYSQLLTSNPKDLDALNGMGRLQMTDKNFTQARSYFNQALQLKPQNSDSILGLAQLNNSTRYMASFNQGQYRVQGQQSDSSVLYGYADINATDRIIGIASHNSKQLQLDLTVAPGVLPNNSIFLNYQRQIPGKYGWGVSYDVRQHNSLPVESRAGGTGNIYLLSALQWFGGFWAGYPSPWNNQLYFSGLTYYTKLPVNVSLTGFWGNQELGGQTATYALDLSKELANSAFYNLGASYNTTQKFWGYHGRIIWPTFKHQAIEGSIEHYNFNAITIFGVGWRVYWA